MPVNPMEQADRILEYLFHFNQGDPFVVALAKQVEAHKARLLDVRPLAACVDTEAVVQHMVAVANIALIADALGVE